MSKTNDPGDIKVEAPLGALPTFARCLAPPLVTMRDAYQRGLGDAGKCSRVTLTFEDDGGPPLLAFHVEVAGEPRVFGEPVIERAAELEAAVEERGAACRTAVKAGLIKPRGAA